MTTGPHETRGEWLFRQMHALYGARFAAMWRNVDSADLMRVWSRALHGMPQETLLSGVEALQGVPHPPTLPEFLDLCRQARLRAVSGHAPRLRSDTRAVAAISVRHAADGRRKDGRPLMHEARPIATDAAASPAGRAFYANASPELRAKYRAVFDAALRARGDALPSREPGEDEEEAQEVTA
ncbi:hypothetical protein R75461_08028 [Paraburkholderia nemoris]|uniref:hypothetical protein n=1 Tax=Paraburkholderia nemoris TaxID=2793076 RepID=UPI00190D5F46|nr:MULTISPECIES: hypothetical protein [Paraburkholderia]MBK3786790.1 hypothetical protein [Paraburkholderia aspalathi]CAE6861878.1 hypothetical protein R75461_08028 [Paraburkholderia nemoris]